MTPADDPSKAIDVTIPLAGFAPAFARLATLGSAM